MPIDHHPIFDDGFPLEACHLSGLPDEALRSLADSACARAMRVVSHNLTVRDPAHPIRAKAHLHHGAIETARQRVSQEDGEGLVAAVVDALTAARMSIRDGYEWDPMAAVGTEYRHQWGELRALRAAASEAAMSADPRTIPGASVRLVQTRGEVTEAHHGRRMTVRRVSSDGASVLCDDGDPTNPDLHTNGFRLATWVAVRAVEWTP